MKKLKVYGSSYEDNFPKEFPEVHPSGVYFHGNLEDLIGYDIVFFSSGDLDKNKHGRYILSLESGEYAVDVVSEGYAGKAVLVYWVSTENRSRGFVVLKNDAEALHYARDMMHSRAEDI